MTTFDRYLLRRFLHTYVILFVTFFGLYVVIDGFTNLDEFQADADGSADTLVVLKRMAIYYGYQACWLVELIGPTLGVCAVMVVAALLVKHSEYQPILAAGIPIFRICWPFAMGLMLVTVGVVFNQEIVIPRVAHHLQGPRSALAVATQEMTPQLDYASGIEIWGKKLDMKNERIMEAEFLLPSKSVVSVVSRITASSARYVPKTEQHPAGWVLENPTPSDYRSIPLTDQGKTIVRPVLGTNEVFIASRIGFDLVADGSRSATRQSTQDLIRRVRNPAMSENLARGQMLLLHQRAVQPLLNLLAGLACIPLVIRRESRSLVASLAFTSAVQGVMFGVLLLGEWLGQSGRLPADIAAWLPVIVCGVVAAWTTGYAQS